MPRPAVLVIAATDSSGGAGLTRDVRVLSELCVDALCVVTAVTAQSDKEVSAVHHVPPEVIRAQIAAAFATRPIDAVKIGMLGTRATVEAVVAELQGRESGRGGGPPGGLPPGRPLLARGLSLPGESRSDGIPIVVDPVLVSSSGGVLLDAGGQAALREALFPLATLVTPNVPEAAALLGEAIATEEAGLVRQGRRLLRFGSQAILLKGGHRYAGRGDGEDAVDLLVYRAAADGDPVERIASKRVTGSSRGTGCALASAVAAGLAAGKPLSEACRAAKSYVLGMLTPAR